MGNFHSNSKGGFRNRYSGNRGGFRGRSRDFERGPVEMHDAICSNCGKKCQVPFRPTGGKSVLCSDCFKQSRGGNDFSERNQGRPAQGGVSGEQLSQINEKLDKVLKILGNLEIEISEEGDEDEDLDDEDDEEEL